MAFYPKNNDTSFCNKRPVLIPEAPRAYFGSASRLSPKRLVLILEAPCAYFGSARPLIKNPREHG